MEAQSIVERPDGPSSRRAVTSSARTSTGCGPRWPPPGRSMRSTPTTAAPRSRARCWSSRAPAGRARARAGLRARGRGSGGGASGRSGGRGGPVRCGRRDDGDRGGARRRARAAQREHPRARPREDRRARRVLRRRSLPRGAHVRADPARAAPRSGGSCGRADGWRSRSGGRASATRGSESCSTRSAPRSASPCLLPASPVPSHSRIRRARRAALRRRAGGRGRQRAACAAARRLLRGVVGEDVVARRAAREGARVATRGSRAGTSCPRAGSDRRVRHARRAGVPRGHAARLGTPRIGAARGPTFAAT